MTDTPEELTGTRRRQTGRSPSYPAISLPTAIDRVSVLYNKERQFATPVEAVVKHWGYTTLNGPAGLALAALKKYALINDEGTKEERRVQVSDLAVRILEHPDISRREEAIKESALKPAIHRELWDLYGPDLPSDSNLMWTLTRDRGFTQNGAREFLKEYRETLDFADLTGTQIAPHLGDDEGEPAHAPVENLKSGIQAFAENVNRYTAGHIVGASPTKTPSASRLQVYTVPVGVGENVVVQGEFPLTEAKWSQFIAVLTAMKPALVGTVPEDEDGSIL